MKILAFAATLIVLLCLVVLVTLSPSPPDQTPPSVRDRARHLEPDEGPDMRLLLRGRTDPLLARLPSLRSDPLLDDQGRGPAVLIDSPEDASVVAGRTVEVRGHLPTEWTWPLCNVSVNHSPAEIDEQTGVFRATLYYGCTGSVQVTACAFSRVRGVGPRYHTIRVTLVSDAVTDARVTRLKRDLQSPDPDAVYGAIIDLWTDPDPLLAADITAVYEASSDSTLKSLIGHVLGILKPSATIPVLIREMESEGSRGAQAESVLGHIIGNEILYRVRRLVPNERGRRARLLAQWWSRERETWKRRHDECSLLHGE